MQGSVDAAWNNGVRYFDTAPFYGAGLSEIRLGKALAGASCGGGSDPGGDPGGAC